MALPDDRDDGFASLARSLREETGEADTLGLAVQLALATITGADEGSVCLIRRRGEVETLHATDQGVETADKLQRQLGEGPCLTSIEQQETVLARDLGADERWPTWGSRVAGEVGFGSVLCLQLFTAGDEYGALSLYARRVDAFDDSDVAVGLAMAAHIAVALASSRQIENLSRSMHSRSVVGQAIGIVRERYGLDAQQAFAFLQRVSSTTNTRLLDVAERLSATGRVPGPH